MSGLEEKSGVSFSKRIALFSVSNSLLVNLFSVFLIGVGIFAMFSLQREAFPNISLDMVKIETVYPGASPAEVEKLVTIPLEDELGEVDDIKESFSVSTEGLSVILMEIDPDASDKKAVVDDIRRAVDRVNDLPDDLPEDPLVTEIKTKDSPVIEVSMTGPVSEFRLQELVRDLEDDLEDIPGVAKVVRSGYRDREFWVEVDPRKAAAKYIALQQVAEALRRRNVRVPGGELRIGPKSYLVRTNGEFETPAEVGEVIVRANEQGNWIRVKDIARVIDTFEDESTILRTMGKRAIDLVVIKKEKGDAIEIVDNVRKEVSEFEEEHSGEISVRLINDISYYIKRRLGVLVNNGTVGVILVLVGLFLFLSPTVAVLTALGIPIAFLTTFAVMGYFSISINLVSMFGLILVLGMLVDDAIVIAENSFRYLEMGLPAREAAVRGMSEVAKPVTATIATTIAAFTPLFHMTGIIGKFMRVIPVVVSVALLASLFEALVILPSHVADFALFFKKKGVKVSDKKQSRWFSVLAGFYDGVLHGALKYRYFVLLGLILVGVGAFWLRQAKIPFILFPRGGIEVFFVRGEAPIGTSLQETSRLIEPVEKILLKIPKDELDALVTTVGVMFNNASDPFTKRGRHYVQVTVYLTPAQHRERTAEEIIESVRPEVENVKGFDRLYFERVNPGPPVGKPVVIRFLGKKYEDLLPLAHRAEEELRKIRGVRDIRDDYELGQEELVVDVNEKAAAKSFLTVAQIAAAVRRAFEGEVATTIKMTEDEDIDVRVRFPEHLRRRIDSLKLIKVLNSRGNLVPLASVASFRKSRGMAFYRHVDRERSITVTADVDESITTSVEVNSRMIPFCRSLVRDLPDTRVKFGGEEEKTRESLQSLFRAFGIAFLLVFTILVATFRSVVQPLVILLAVPFGLIGVVLAFYFHGWPLTFLALMGVVGLTGVVVNDSIILVDFINQSRRRGMPRRQSIVEAGHTRLRPVLLTTITTVVGLLPVAYGIGGGDPFLKPMALSITYGLAFATTLTLIAIPCIYAIIDDLVCFVGRCRGDSE